MVERNTVTSETGSGPHPFPYRWWDIGAIAGTTIGAVAGPIILGDGFDWIYVVAVATGTTIIAAIVCLVFFKMEHRDK